MRTGESVGIDMGVATLATLSDGTTVENPRPLAAALRRLRHLDKAIARSRKLNGNKPSNRRRRLMDRRARLHERIKALRNDVHHKATTAMVKRYAEVHVETLNVAGMMRNRRVARALADTGVSSFLWMLDYKSELYGSVFTKADRWFASTMTCHACGTAKDGMQLSERTFRCECGAKIDRDLNAALNLKAAGSCSDAANGRGVYVSPAPPATCDETSTRPRLSQISEIIISP